MYNYGDGEINYQRRFPRWDTLFFSFSYHKITLFEKKYDIKLITLISTCHLKPLVSLGKRHSVITASISVIRPKIVKLKPSVSSVEKDTHIKDARTERKSNQNVQTVKDHMLPIIKGVQPTKNRCSDNIWWTTKKAMLQF